MNKIRIGGRSFENVRSISVDGRTVRINGEIADGISTDGNTLHIQVSGDLASLDCDGSATITGSVRGNVESGGSVNCGDVMGDVNSGGSTSCKNIAGNLDADGSVRANAVGGSITANGGVKIS